MKIDPTFLRSRVARRIFLLFVLCAFVPISALAFVSFRQVTDQLKKQSQRRLHQSSKALAMTILERLTFLDNDLKILSSGFHTNRGAPMSAIAGEEYGEILKQRFQRLSLVKPEGESIPVLGHIQRPPTFSLEERGHLQSGKSLLRTHSIKGDLPQIYLARAVKPQDPDGGVLYGQINAPYLLGLHQEDTLPAMTELCLLDSLNRVLFSTVPITPSFLGKFKAQKARSTVGRFEWEYEGKEYLGSFRSVFLKFWYSTAHWTIVLSEPKSYIFSPLAYFKKVFPLVTLLSFLVILLLSASQIRRTTQPIEKLREGTERIALKDFHTRVSVKSNDEFEQLAGSFNDMAKQLGRQFHALTTMSEIDRAILSALDTEKIVDTVITRMDEIFDYDSAAVILFDWEGKRPARRFLGTREPGSLEVSKSSDRIEIAPREIAALSGEQEILQIRTGEDPPHSLTPLLGDGHESWVVLPLFVKDTLAGLIALGSTELADSDEEDLVRARQLADQVAVALSNAKLIEELALLNWGTLTALARAVDAKSPWTAGHSERVTELALKIGRAMALSSEELEDLHRGGLLHDIGKIGISASILDKPGKLTDEEFRNVQSHAQVGARILEPIAAFSRVIPMVLEHHERYDGKGYPQALSGEKLSLGARILAVADVYDALVSDRPYRSGMDPEYVISIIKEEAGKQFDPMVVEAFLEVMKEKRGKGYEETED